MSQMRHSMDAGKYVSLAAYIGMEFVIGNAGYGSD
jgi:hypothetical protein